MANVTELKVIMQSALASLPQEERAAVSASQPEDLRTAMDLIATESASVTAVQAAAAVINGTVSNWTALETLATAAKSNAIEEVVKAFKESRLAHDAPATLARAFVIGVLAEKHFSV